jgi:hypothetical protein
MAKNSSLLIDACCDARENPNFAPNGDLTFCNEAVAYIADRMGYVAFHGLLANAMYDLMDTNSDWLKIDSGVAQYHANNGSLVVAAMKNNDGHGHVAVVRPGTLTQSNRWKSSQVPRVVNIGKDVFIDKGVNYAFQEMPDFFVWKEST